MKFHCRTWCYIQRITRGRSLQLPPVSRKRRLHHSEAVKTPKQHRKPRPRGERKQWREWLKNIIRYAHRSATRQSGKQHSTSVPCDATILRAHEPLTAAIRGQCLSAIALFLQFTEMRLLELNPPRMLWVRTEFWDRWLFGCANIRKDTWFESKWTVMKPIGLVDIL